MILLISASWVARITGVNHWCPAVMNNFHCKARWFYAKLTEVISLVFLESKMFRVFFLHVELVTPSIDIHPSIDELKCYPNRLHLLREKYSSKNELLWYPPPPFIWVKDLIQLN
jgi:hypothetical protein